MTKKKQQLPPVAAAPPPSAEDSASLREAANLRVLKRLDATITEIIGSASHTVLYEGASGKWIKKDIEGTMFIVKRSVPCRFRLIVLNRSNPENFTYDIDSNMQNRMMENFLMFKSKLDGNEDMRGLYFHDGEEKMAMNALISECKERQREASVKVSSTALCSLRATPPSLDAVVLSFASWRVREAATGEERGECERRR